MRLIIITYVLGFMSHAMQTKKKQHLSCPIFHQKILTATDEILEQ